MKNIKIVDRLIRETTNRYRSRLAGERTCLFRAIAILSWRGEDGFASPEKVGAPHYLPAPNG